MTTAGSPIHVAIAQSMPALDPSTNQLITAEGVHLSQLAEDNGLTPDMFRAYATAAIRELHDAEIQPGYQATDEYHSPKGQGPRVTCKVQPLWMRGPENEPHPRALRISIIADHDVVGTAYAELSETSSDDTRLPPETPAESRLHVTSLPRHARQLTLGELISEIEQVSDDSKPVEFDFGDVPPGDTQMLDCYARHPHELAMRHRRPEVDRRMTSAEIIIENLVAAVGCVFIDHRGQEQRMTQDTPLWAANWRQDTRNAIIGLDELPDAVVIRTWRVQ